MVSMQETESENADTQEETAAAESIGTEAETTAAETAEPKGETADAETAASAESEAAGSLTAGAYSYHLETKTQSWDDASGQEACSVSLEYPVFEGGTDAENAMNAL